MGFHRHMPGTTATWGAHGSPRMSLFCFGFSSNASLTWMSWNVFYLLLYWNPHGLIICMHATIILYKLSLNLKCRENLLHIYLFWEIRGHASRKRKNYIRRQCTATTVRVRTRIGWNNGVWDWSLYVPATHKYELYIRFHNMHINLRGRFWAKNNPGSRLLLLFRYVYGIFIAPR